MKRLPCILTLVSLSGLTGIVAQALTFVPMSIDDLTRSSVAAVIGTVEGVTGIKSSDGQIFTLVRVVIDEVLRGNVEAPVITLKEPGGSAEGEQDVLFGTPSFQAGEHVLLFLTVGDDGSLRTNHLALGKFGVELGGGGLPRASQHFGRGTTIVVPPGVSPLPASIPLDDLIRAVRAVTPTSDAAPSFEPEPPEAAGAFALSEYSEPYTFLQNPPARFFEVDEGLPMSYLVDQNGDATLGLVASKQAVDDAFAEWTNVATASISLVDAGLTSDLNLPCTVGAHKVIFNDPHGIIPKPAMGMTPGECAGVLALGGLCSVSTETKVFNGTTFRRALQARATFADGWGACTDWTQCNIAEVATHEIGHSIGLGHSSQKKVEPNPTLADATMYYEAHFDGRCADVRTDDINGVTFLYPTAIPPTITTANPLPVGTVNVAYSQTLSATGGSGMFTWSLAAGSFPGLSLSGATISGTPTFTGMATFFVKATDALGNSHTKRFDIPIGPHDSVVLPVNPLTVNLAPGTLSVSKTVKVKVRNAGPEISGHTIQLSATTSDCPGGTIAGIPDLDPRNQGSQNSLFIFNGKTKTAKVPLFITSAAFATFNRKAPKRCTITFTASSPGTSDPRPSNDSVTMELNVIDKNDPTMTAVHESVIASINPLAVNIPKNKPLIVKKAKPAVVNADLVAPLELPAAHSTQMTVSSDTCGLLSTPDFDTSTPAADDSAGIGGGSSKKATVLVTATAASFTTANVKSPQRCTAVLTAVGPTGDTDAANNTTKLVIDVIDKNDF